MGGNQCRFPGMTRERSASGPGARLLIANHTARRKGQVAPGSYTEHTRLDLFGIVIHNGDAEDTMRMRTQTDYQRFRPEHPVPSASAFSDARAVAIRGHDD